MKLRTIVNLENQNNQCQFGVEVDLDDNAEFDEIQERTNKATAALKMAINTVVNIKALNNTPAASSKPKQLPGDPASQGQIKYLNDLTSKCGTTLNRWSKEHGVKQDSITGAHCKAWIPELNQKIKEKMNDDEKFFLS